MSYSMMMTEDTYTLKPTDGDLLDQLDRLSAFVEDFQDDEDLDGDDALVQFLVNAGKAELYRRMRQDDVIPAGWNPELESRMELPTDDVIRGYD